MLTDEQLAILRPLFKKMDEFARQISIYRGAKMKCHNGTPEELSGIVPMPYYKQCPLNHEINSN